MNLTKRHAEFAQKFIAEVAKQTTIEGLSSLLQKDYFKTDEKVKNRWDSGEHLLVETFGKRRRECLEVFAAKYMLSSLPLKHRF